MPTIKLPFTVKRPILACGADMKGAFAVAQGSVARLYDGYGDLAEIDNLVRYEKDVGRAARMVKPALVACDMHPGYFSSHVAESLRDAACDLPICRVQHHEAHIAGAIVDHGIAGSVIGVAFDGTGYGADGMAWGGEFLVGNARRFVRAAHLAYVPLPGGDRAVREPWRTGASYLYRACGERWTGMPIDFSRRLHKKKWRLVKEMIDRKVGAPMTSSAGRLFDAAGSIILARHGACRDAELPVALERIASTAWADAYGFRTRRDGPGYLIDASPAIKGIAADLAKGVPPALVAGAFHGTVASIIAKTCAVLRKTSGVRKVVLGGGVFQNKILSDRAVFMLSADGFTVYRSVRVATTDSGIPIGQIAIAKARARCV